MTIAAGERCPPGRILVVLELERLATLDELI